MRYQCISVLEGYIILYAGLYQLVPLPTPSWDLLGVSRSKCETFLLQKLGVPELTNLCGPHSLAYRTLHIIHLH
jgi:hypothetical protein